METKQTAIEWLEREFIDSRVVYGHNFIMDKLKQAKQMEKEQIEEAFNNSSWFIDGKEYYDKTYGN